MMMHVGENVLLYVHEQNLSNVVNEMLDVGPQIMQLALFLDWKSHFEEKDVCVTVRGLA